jgi:hypothetical protein
VNIPKSTKINCEWDENVDKGEFVGRL